MSFLHPEILYYLLPLVFILFGFLLSQKEKHETYFSKEVMDKLRATSDSFSLRVRNVFFFIITLLIVVALANPVIKNGMVEVKAKSSDIIIALDISDSMLGEDIYPNRLNAAKEKAIELLRLAPNERIGVIAFAKNSYLVSPLSFDHNAVGFLLSQLDTTSITEKGTNLLNMLQVVDESIKKESKKYVLMLSDGGDKDDFSEEIAFAKEKNIAVFVLGMGTIKGSPIKRKDGNFIKQNGKIIISKLNEDIADLATKTGGVYIQNVRSDEDIKTMLSEIENNSVKRELKSEEVERFEPLFYYPLGLAILLLLIATSSMYKGRGVVVTLFMILSLYSQESKLNAGILDFLELKDAKKAYEAKEYENSAKIYENYAKKSDNQESYYNAGNAMYKEKKYAEAIKSYEKSSFTDENKKAKKYANIGNAYAKQAKPKMLEKAVESYEKSLKIKEDKDTRENLEAVKKALKQQEKKSDKNKDNKKNKDDKEKKNRDNKDSKNKKKSDDKKDSKEKKDSKDGKNSDKQSDKKKESQKNPNKPDENMNSKEEQEKKKEREKKEEEKKKKLKELGKDDKKQDKAKQPNERQGAVQNKKEEMSNAEEAKWLGKLNSQKNTYMYMLNKENKLEEDSNEKPW
ncbi:MAG: VWA domain-containing protein [Sulfurimonas sp.]